MKFLFGIIIILFSAPMIFGKGGYEIKVKIENYKEKELYFGYHFADKQYLKDTAKMDADGTFTFKGDKELEGGIYLIITPPDKKYFQVLINKGDQHFSLTTNEDLSLEKMKVKGSPDNKLFYEYMGYLSSRRPYADSLKNIMSKLDKVKDKAEYERLDNQINKIDKDVNDLQLKIIKENKGSLTAEIIRASRDIDVPEYSDLDKKEAQFAKYYYYKDHYFDNINMSDPRMLRTPLMQGKIDYYLTKIVPQHPDSISIGIDKIMELIKGNEESLKFYSVHFINYYAKSEFVGMDAVYVHLSDEYLEKGKMPWISKEDSTKIVENAHALKPILIGKTAPDLKPLLKLDSTGYSSLYSIKSPYTLVYFWNPDCGHCKKTTPYIVEFYEKFKDKGVEVCAICTEVGESAVKKCMDSAKEKGLDKLKFSYVDPWLFTKYKTLYDVKSTPQIFILDDKHEIIMKKIAGEQLIDVMGKIQEFKKNKQN